MQLIAVKLLRKVMDKSLKGIGRLTTMLQVRMQKRKGKERKGKVRKGKARTGKERKGKERKGKERT